MNIFRVILLFAFINSPRSSTAADLTCKEAIAADFTAQAYLLVQKFPSLKQSNPHKTNPASKAFIWWRSRTPPHIPDNVFYSLIAASRGELSFEEFLRSQARWLSRSEEVLGEVDDLTQKLDKSIVGKPKHTLISHLSSGARPFKITSTEQDYIRPYIDTLKKQFGSVENALKKLQISPWLSKNKLMHLSSGQYNHLKIIIAGDGRIFSLSADEQALLESHLIDPNAPQQSEWVRSHALYATLASELNSHIEPCYYWDDLLYFKDGKLQAAYAATNAAQSFPVIEYLSEY